MAVDKELRHLQEQQSERERNSVPRTPATSEFLDAMSQAELKNVILELFDQQREMIARLAEKDRANDEKDRMIATLTEKLDAVLENQKQQKLDLESWLAKERQWNKEREGLQKTISDLNDLVKVLKKAKFVGTSQKSAKKNGGKGPDGKKDGNGDAGSSPASAPEPDLAENKEGFDGNDEDGSIAAAADKDVKPEGGPQQRKDGPDTRRHVQLAGASPQGRTSTEGRTDGQGPQLHAHLLEAAHSMA